MPRSTAWSPRFHRTSVVWIEICTLTWKSFRLTSLQSVTGKHRKSWSSSFPVQELFVLFARFQYHMFFFFVSQPLVRRERSLLVGQDSGAVVEGPGHALWRVLDFEAVDDRHPVSLHDHGNAEQPASPDQPGLPEVSSASFGRLFSSVVFKWVIDGLCFEVVIHSWTFENTVKRFSSTPQVSTIRAKMHPWRSTVSWAWKSRTSFAWPPKRFSVSSPTGVTRRF